MVAGSIAQLVGSLGLAGFGASTDSVINLAPRPRIMGNVGSEIGKEMAF
jgi:hypothetical protein